MVFRNNDTRNTVITLDDIDQRYVIIESNKVRPLYPLVERAIVSYITFDCVFGTLRQLFKNNTSIMNFLKLVVPEIENQVTQG